MPGIKRANRGTRMRSRGLLTELLGRPAKESLWLRLAGWLVRARAELFVLATMAAVHVLVHAQTVGRIGCAPAPTPPPAPGVHGHGPVIAASMPTSVPPPEVVCSGSHTVALLIEVGAVGLLMVIGPARRYVTRRGWAVCDRHRIWTCLVQTRTMTPDGRLPLLVWARPTPIGERICVLLRAGLSVSDLDQISEALAAACYAAEARVTVNAKWTNLAVITIVRRDPFTGKTIRPKHTGGVPSSAGHDSWSPLPDRDSVTVPDNGPYAPGHQAGKPRRASQNGRATVGNPAGLEQQREDRANRRTKRLGEAEQAHGGGCRWDGRVRLCLTHPRVGGSPGYWAGGPPPPHRPRRVVPVAG